MPPPGLFTGTHTFTVFGNQDVPELTQVATFLSYAPYVTSPATLAHVLATGFDVEWGGSGGGTVILSIFGTDGENADVEVETENDGQYHFDASQLAGLPSAFPVLLELKLVSETAINATGYDPNSVTRCKNWNTTQFYVDSE
jgi:hypothetical protein